MTAAQASVLVVGGVGVDHIVRVPTIPVPQADSLLVPPIRTYVGHTGNGVALGLQALGLPVTLVDVIGDDPEGRLVREHYVRHGLATDFVTDASGTRRSVNLVGDDGGRMSFYDPRHPFELVPDPGLWQRHLPGATHVHASIMNWARHALVDAREAGLTTSTDLHDWDGVGDYHRDFALGADIVFCSGALLGGEDGQHRLIDQVFGDGRAHTVVVMDGARGSLVATRDDRHHVPAVSIPDRPVVDSNGAGDAYVAAYLAAVLRGEGPRAAGAAGAWAGAYACGTAGTHTSFVTWDELARLTAG